MLENTNLSRRTFLGASGAAAAMLGLAACGGGVTTSDFALAAQVRVYALQTLDSQQ